MREDKPSGDFKALIIKSFDSNRITLRPEWRNPIIDAYGGWEPDRGDFKMNNMKIMLIVASIILILTPTISSKVLESSWISGFEWNKHNTYKLGAMPS